MTIQCATLLVKFTMLVAFLGYLTAPTPARAIPITYTLSPAVIAPNLGDTITGSFTFDASGHVLDSVDLTVTGTTGPGVYTTPLSPSSQSASGIAAFLSTCGSACNFLDEIILLFGAPLSTGPATVTGGAVANVGPLIPSQGVAVPISTVPAPEPASLALLITSLGLFVFSRRIFKLCHYRRIYVYMYCEKAFSRKFAFRHAPRICSPAAWRPITGRVSCISMRSPMLARESSGGKKPASVSSQWTT